MSRNWGIARRNEYSSEFKSTIGLGFFIAFAILVGSLAGVFIFFATLLIDPGFDLQPVQYQARLQSDR
jgi:hypothetical protein